MSRLRCCVCGADLGDAEDPYRDPDCADCLRREYAEEIAREEELDDDSIDAPNVDPYPDDFDTPADREDDRDNYPFAGDDGAPRSYTWDSE